MTQTITLNLPDKLYEPIQRMAQATNRSVETVLLTALQTSLPSLEGLPEELAQELIKLETLDNDKLRQILLEMVPIDLRLSFFTWNYNTNSALFHSL